jgi:hypothetical protein
LKIAQKATISLGNYDKMLPTEKVTAFEARAGFSSRRSFYSAHSIPLILFAATSKGTEIAIRDAGTGEATEFEDLRSHFGQQHRIVRCRQGCQSIDLPATTETTRG